MPVNRVFSSLALLALVVYSPAAEPEIAFRMSDYRLSFNQRLRTEIDAPIIVVGRVLDVHDLGQPIRSPGDFRIKTQLTRIRIAVENVVKGTVGKRVIEFYYYAYSTESDVDLGVPRYLPEIGQRRIYFLTPWETTYRSIGDVTNFTLQVRSGIHRDTFCRGKQPGCCIAETLLVPGKNLDVPSFAAGLIEAKAAASFLCSAARTRGLLQSLAENTDKRISDRANQVLQMEQ